MFKRLLQAKSYKLKAPQSGFTLLELLVVIAIIAILIALGTISYSTAQKKSRDAKRSSDLKEIQNALETYTAVNDQYPGGTYPAGIDAATGEYFPSGNVPTDPKTGNAYTAVTYTTSVYCICATLEIVDTGNSDLTCDYGAAAADKDYFCVSSLQ